MRVAILQRNGNAMQFCNSAAFCNHLTQSRVEISNLPIRSTCRAPDAFTGPDVAQLAPQILGFIDEKDAAVHPAMWDMLLSFGRAYPTAWSAVNARKAVLPRLMALLRYSDHPHLQIARRWHARRGSYCGSSNDRTCSVIIVTCGRCAKMGMLPKDS